MIKFQTSKCQAAFGLLIMKDLEFRDRFLSWSVAHHPEYAHTYELDRQTYDVRLVKENWNPPAMMIETDIFCADIDPETHMPREVAWCRYAVPCNTDYGLPTGEPRVRQMNGAWINHGKEHSDWGCHT